VFDDQKQFEFLVLESAQAGLSWITILKKRENFRKAYKEFNAERVANFNNKKIEELMQDVGIIRNRKKIEASVGNAKIFLGLQEEYGSFCKYIWGFTDGKPIINSWKKLSEIPASTALSDAIAKDLKGRGFKFVGSTIIYAHMQAVGIVNDHTVDCFRHKEVQT
ncbi:MAG: DNA-3-methyladenine glycosylase I, partial [Thermodesulfobacteriota bacterium]